MKKRFIYFGIFVICVLAARSGGAQEELTKKDEAILYSSYKDGYWQIFATDLEGKKSRQLTFSAIDKRAPQCSDDGVHIYYRTANAELFKLNAETGAETRLLEKYGSILDLDVSRDGKRMVFARLRSDLLDDSDVWIKHSDEEDARYITNETGLQYGPVFNETDDSVIYVSHPKETYYHNILRHDLKTREKEALTDTGHFDFLPCLDLSGRRMAFISNRSGNFDIWSMDLSKKDMRKLTDFEGIDTMPQFLSDGRIIFISTRTGQKQLWVMDPDGGNQRRLGRADSPVQEPFSCRHMGWILEKEKGA